MTNYDLNAEGIHSRQQTLKDVESVKISFQNLYYPNDTVTVGVYSPNEAPTTQSELSFTYNSQDYTVSFNEVSINRLPPPFKTMCKNYEIGDPKAVQSRSDCISKCMFQKLTTMPNVSRDLYIWLTNEDTEFNKYYINRQAFRYSDVILTQYEGGLDQHDILIPDSFRLSEECPKLCPADCVSSTFVVKYVSKKPLNFDYLMSGYLYPEITFTHDDNYDVFLKHSPQMDWVTFLGSVGGLAGMWIGFSFLNLPTTLSNQLFSAFKKICLWYFRNYKRNHNRKNVQIPRRPNNSWT